MSRIAGSWMRPNPDHDEQCRSYATWIATMVPAVANLDSLIMNTGWLELRELADYCAGMREKIRQAKQL